MTPCGTCGHRATYHLAHPVYRDGWRTADVTWTCVGEDFEGCDCAAYVFVDGS